MRSPSHSERERYLDCSRGFLARGREQSLAIAVEWIFTRPDGRQVGTSAGEKVDCSGEGIGPFALKRFYPISEAADYEDLFHPDRSPVHPFGHSGQAQDNERPFSAQHAQ